MKISLPPWPATPPSHGSVILRQYRDDDAHLVQEMGEDEYIAQMGALPPHPTTEQALAYINAYRQWAADGVGFGFAIADKTTDRALGEIVLRLDLGIGIATTGYSVSPLHRRKGVATQALRALVAYAWTIPVLYRIELETEPSNHASIRVAESAGFRLHGTGHREIGGATRAVVRYVLNR
ncbi:GNAT family N-acetyltransferase [Actinocrispum sp. NPDC049592]|uniref:GNAT family N-acetyltransferase n=1 Tax=Actinocrispum sp. NPDC049592 TaxID=3154835 RepID=UPI003437F954